MWPMPWYDDRFIGKGEETVLDGGEELAGVASG
jgi:hypothetical protein